ncbi:MAG: hypothetical protein ABII71_05590 [Candidatus Micrarchaeota archaeon]
MKKLTIRGPSQAEHIRASDRKEIRENSLAERPEFGRMKPAIEKMEAPAKSLMEKANKGEMALLPTALTHQDIEGIILSGRKAAIELVAMEKNGGGGAYRELLPENPGLLREALQELPMDGLLSRIKRTLDNDHPLVRTETALLLAAITLDDEIFDSGSRSRAFQMLALSSLSNSCTDALMQCFGQNTNITIVPPYTMKSALTAIGGGALGFVIEVIATNASVSSLLFTLGGAAVGGMASRLYYGFKHARIRREWIAARSLKAPAEIDALKLLKKAEAEKALLQHESKEEKALPAPEGEVYTARDKQFPLKC